MWDHTSPTMNPIWLCAASSSSVHLNAYRKTHLGCRHSWEDGIKMSSIFWQAGAEMQMKSHPSVPPGRLKEILLAYERFLLRIPSLFLSHYKVGIHCFCGSVGSVKHGVCVWRSRKAAIDLLPQVCTFRCAYMSPFHSVLGGVFSVISQTSTLQLKPQRSDCFKSWAFINHTFCPNSTVSCSLWENECLKTSSGKTSSLVFCCSQPKSTSSKCWMLGHSHKMALLQITVEVLGVALQRDPSVLASCVIRFIRFSWFLIFRHT